MEGEAGFESKIERFFHNFGFFFKIRKKTISLRSHPLVFNKCIETGL